MSTALLTATRPELTIAPTKAPVNNHFSRHQLRTMAEFGTQVEIAAGDQAVPSEIVGAEAFIVVSGTATISSADAVVSAVGPGEAFGECSALALNSLARPTAGAIAASELVMYAFTPAQLRSLFADCPHLGKRLRKTAAVRSQRETADLFL